MNKCIVYGLIASDEYLIRYIGQTVQRLPLRLKAHIWTAKKTHRTSVQRWIASVIARGAAISAVVLEQGAELHEAEKRHIAFHRELGAALLNLTDGGEGTVGHRFTGTKKPWLAERNRQRAGQKGRPRTPEETERLMQYVRGAKRPWVAERNRANAGKPGRKHTEEHKTHMRAILTGHPVSDETKAKIGDANRGRKRSPEIIERMRNAQLRRYAALRGQEVTHDLHA